MKFFRVLPVLLAGLLVSPTLAEDSTSADGLQPDDNNLVALCMKSQYVGNGPFCAPKNDTKLYTTGKYYVSWDSGIWNPNSTVSIQLNYKKSGLKGNVAYSWDGLNSLGYMILSPQKSWMVNQTAYDEGFNVDVKEQELYFTITSNSVEHAGARNQHKGATIHLIADAVPVEIDKQKRNPVSWLGLAIGIPLVVVFIVTMVFGTHFCMRNKRQIGPIAIGGGRRPFKKQGYSGRKARQQRAMQGGNSEYRDEYNPQEDMERGRTRSREWELANVQGGR